MLEISPEKVSYVILRAREVDVKTGAWDDDATADADDATSETILEDLPGDATWQELEQFLRGMNEDELASLIALAWIGRGTYAAAELDDAIATAKDEHTGSAISYLLGLPLLADYLEDAMDQLGYPVEAEERDLMR
jgi:hypothetical protein